MAPLFTANIHNPPPTDVETKAPPPHSDKEEDK